MTIAPIGALASIAAPSAATATSAAGTAAATPTSFGSDLNSAVNNLQQTQATAATDEAQMAAGQGNLADTMIAASEASLQTQVTNDLLSKAISSYNDIMNMSF